MSAMPRRPREHEIETESRNAFRSLLPSSWVVRDVPEDYGIDLEVEIFKDGVATGLMFRVQVKGTDKAPRKGRLSRSGIKAQSLNYWRSLDVPVLVAFYSTPTDTFYVRWAHGYDSHYAKNPEAKTLTFNYGPQHKLNRESLDDLVDDARFFRTVQRQELRYPMPIHFKPSNGVQSHSDQRIRAQLRQAVDASRGLLVLSDNEHASTVLTIDDSTIRAVLSAELRSTTWHLESDQYADQRGFVGLVADVMLAIANLFIRVGAVGSAVELTKIFAQEARLFRVEGVLSLFVKEFLAEGYVSDVFHLIKNLIDSPSRHDRDFAEFVLAAIFADRGPYNLDAVEVDAMAERLRKRAEIERSERQPVKSGRTLYNIGEIYRGMSDWQSSLEAFDIALANDPTYAKRGYFWRARGSLHYELNQYDEAASDYRMAVTCGDAPEAALLLSDVLMRSGDYEEAASVPVRAEASDYYALGERLNRRILTTITTVVGVPEQNRQDPGVELINTLSESLLEDEIVAALREHDALDARLWHLLVGAKWESDLEGSLAACVVAADLARINPDLWALAGCLAVGQEASEKEVDDICDSGLKWCGPKFLDAVERLCETGPDEFTSEVRAKVYARADRERPRWPRVVRFVDEDGTYQTLELS